MRRRLKRRGNKNIDPQDAPWGDERTHGKLPQDDDDDKELSVSSPPRLRRDKDSINNISSTREFRFNLEDAGGSPVIDTDGGGTISTVTNDQAFRDDVFRCGFDNEEYGVMKQQQSQLLTKGDQAHLQLQMDWEEEFAINMGSRKKTQASPMGVNEVDFPDKFEWADFDSSNMGSKARQGPSSAKLNLRKSPKRDDDSFFYSASAPSEATNDTKLVGETITLGSTSSYLHSFDILDNDRKAETPQSARLDIHQMGMGHGSSPKRQSSPFDSSQTRQTKEVHTAAAAAAVTAPPPPPPPQAPRQRGQFPKEDISNKADSTKPGSGCAMPDIVQEFVEDVKSVLSQVITVAYLACSEGEQCLSRCQGDEPEPEPSQLNTIVEDSTVPVQHNSPSVVRADESKRFNKPWAGDYLCRRTATEETADTSEEAEGKAQKSQGSRTHHRLKKFLTSFKTRR